MEPLELFTRRKILTVSELVGQLKKLAESHFDFVWVEGEVSGLRRPGSGHFYFALKDDKALLRAVLFRHQASLLRFNLEDGLSVLCQGRLSVYQPRGEVQLVVDTVEPRGAGALALAFAQLKTRLEAEGLFDQARKKNLPDLPQRIAVVTSPTGAAIRDFLKVLHRRHERVQVAVYPVPVQGNEAPGKMIQALEDLAAWGWPEVIVLTRGGGSPEDLWAYNDEALARAIAACPIPVVSAVGHEVDVTISDLAADLRAPTPSAAAEILVKPLADLTKRLADLTGRLGLAGRRLVERRRAGLESLRHGLGDPRRRLADLRLFLDDLVHRSGRAVLADCHNGSRRLWRLQDALTSARPDMRVAELRARHMSLMLRLKTAAAGGTEVRRARLMQLNGRLQALGPLAVLSRGYALVTDEAGRVVRSASQARVGDGISIRLAQGGLMAEVKEVSS